MRHNGTVRARRIDFHIGRPYAGQTVHVLYHATTIEFFDRLGTLIVAADVAHVLDELANPAEDDPPAINGE